MIKKLIIAPHVDDDVLGCGGILDETCHVVYCGLDETDIDDRPSMDERLNEIKQVQKITNHTFDILDNLVNRYDEYKLIGQIEKIINNDKPDEVYVCHPSYNQDHRTVYDATMVALRPHDKNHFVNKVFIYEQPHMLFWDNGGVDFKPNYFIPIDIDKKVKVYTTMKSQVRSFRSPEHLEAMGKLRGGQSSCEYAEAYQILRWVNE
jgi:LmbE family N-acetylglucosaminyl deacetylase